MEAHRLSDYKNFNLNLIKIIIDPKTAMKLNPKFNSSAVITAAAAACTHRKQFRRILQIFHSLR